MSRKIGLGIIRCGMLALVIALAACAGPQTQAIGPSTGAGRLEQAVFITRDGAELPVEIWVAEDPTAIAVGIHGMNDYAKTFRMPGPWFAERGITFYAYDQRGFGRAPQPGLWAGGDVLIDDAAEVLASVRARHPGLPVFAVGVSMGAAVAMSLLENRGSAVADGLVLVSPAVWGWSTLNPVYRATLWIAAHTFPAATLTGSSLEIWPSDNIEMLRDNFNDPLFIKATRTDSIFGLVTLMERGFDSAAGIQVPTLILYGAKDEIIPPRPVERMISTLKSHARLVVYPDGYHMLLRDLQRQTVWTDMLAWMRSPVGRLPSGHEVPLRTTLGKPARTVAP